MKIFLTENSLYRIIAENWNNAEQIASIHNWIVIGILIKEIEL